MMVLAALRLVLGGVFLYAAGAKLGDMSAFAEQVANFRLLPAATVAFTAATLPGIEMVAGALLVLGIAARAAAAIAAASLLVFIGALTLALARGINLECGCFGGADIATWTTVARDLMLLVPALAVMIAGPGRLTNRTAPE